MRHIYLWAIASKQGWRASFTSSDRLTPRFLFGTQTGAQRHLDGLAQSGETGLTLHRFLVLELPADQPMPDAELAVLKDYTSELLK